MYRLIIRWFAAEWNLLFELLSIIIIISGLRILTKYRICRGDFFTGDNVMWHRPVGSIAVVCSSPAVVPLFRIELSFCCVHRSKVYRVPQQRLPMLFIPQNFPFPRRMSTPAKIHLRKRRHSRWKLSQELKWTIISFLSYYAHAKMTSRKRERYKI